MRLRTLSAAGLGAAALVLALLPTGAATASGHDGSGVSLKASGATSSHGGSATSNTITKKGKCKTKFGPELPTVDGIISWNDTSGASFDTAGAADVTCKKATKIKTTSVYGYFGAAQETFHVTFYANSTTNGSNEPDDTKVICDIPSVTGAAGGQYPTHALTTLKLTPKCTLKKGIYWVSVQNANSAGPWYWEMQDTQSGNGPDWNDVHDAFGSGCTTYDNDRYLVDCLGYPYGDWMLLLG